MFFNPQRTLLCLALALLLPTLGANAGEKVLGAPSYDNYSETTYRQVSWDDFRGKGKKPPGWNRWRKGSFAHIATAINLGHFETESHQDNDQWVTKPVGIRPYAVMAKDFSAVQHGSRNDSTLEHEQLHFDIAEMMARRIAVRLSGITARGATPEESQKTLQQQIETTFAKGIAELDEIQASYDGDTGHSVQKRKQKRWGKDVAKMFDEATRDLKEVLEARKEQSS